MIGLCLALGVSLALGALIDRALFDVPEAALPERFGRALMWGLGATGALSMAADAAGLGVSLASVGSLIVLLALLLLRPAVRARARVAGAVYEACMRIPTGVDFGSSAAPSLPIITSHGIS
jgi:hypothetical protein